MKPVSSSTILLANSDKPDNSVILDLDNDLFCDIKMDNLKEINDKWNNIYSFKIDKPKHSKVRFHETPNIKYMICWGFAYRNARKGHWQQFAIDRCRFKDRIKSLEPILNDILSHHFRDYIFNQHIIHK